MASEMFLLQFTKADIYETFKKTKEQSDGITDGSLVLVTEDMYDSVIRFLRDTYVPYEPVSAALGLDKESSDWEIMWRPSLKLNLSLAVVDSLTTQIIGVFVLGIAKVIERPDLTLYSDTKIRSYVEVADYWDRKGSVFKHYDVRQLVAFKELSVDLQNKRRGIASFLTKTALYFVKNLAVFPVYIRVGATSNFSKICFEKNGFETLYEFRYDEYLKDDIQLIPDTGMHTSITMYGQKQ